VELREDEEERGEAEEEHGSCARDVDVRLPIRGRKAPVAARLSICLSGGQGAGLPGSKRSEGRGGREAGTRVSLSVWRV